MASQGRRRKPADPLCQHATGLAPGALKNVQRRFCHAPPATGSRTPLACRGLRGSNRQDRRTPDMGANERTGHPDHLSLRIRSPSKTEGAARDSVDQRISQVRAGYDRHAIELTLCVFDCAAVEDAFGAVSMAANHRWAHGFQQIRPCRERNTTGVGQIRQPYHKRITAIL